VKLYVHSFLFWPSELRHYCPESGDSTIPRNVGTRLPDYTVSCPRRTYDEFFHLVAFWVITLLPWKRRQCNSPKRRYSPTRLHRIISRRTTTNLHCRENMKLHVVTWRLKAEIVEPEETFIVRQRLGKQVPAETKSRLIVTTPTRDNWCQKWDWIELLDWRWQ
jgi:hypothetical protein